MVWATNGAAVAAVGALVFEVVSRRWPVDPAWPVLVLCAAVGLAVALAGWLRGWPSWTQVAQLADVRLGGQERLVTALEFAGAGGSLNLRQRADATAFAQRADLGGMQPIRLPTRMLVVAVAAALGPACWPSCPTRRSPISASTGRRGRAGQDGTGGRGSFQAGRGTGEARGGPGEAPGARQRAPEGRGSRQERAGTRSQRSQRSARRSRT